MNIENYTKIEKLGEGGFGKVYKYKNNYTKELVAIKFEKKDNYSLLKNEAKIYNLLRKCNGISNLRGWGSNDINYYMIIDILYPLKKEKKHYTTYCKEMLDIIKVVHDMGIIHRDLKPSNFMITQENSVRLIDFGLSKMYRENKNHIQLCYNNEPIGSFNYISINVHKGFNGSRRDDVVSILYIYLNFINMGLPWDSLEDNENILTNKIEYFNEKSNLSKLIHKITNLKFSEKPNYSECKKYFI